jgi:hypothetical protein
VPCGRGHERCGLCCACSVRPERYCSNPLVPSGVRCSWLAIDACACLYTAPHAIWRGVRRYTPRRAALTLVPRCRRRGMADTDPWELHRITRMGRYACTCVALCSDGRARFTFQRCDGTRGGVVQSTTPSTVHLGIKASVPPSIMRQASIVVKRAWSTLVSAPVEAVLYAREAHTTTQWVERSIRGRVVLSNTSGCGAGRRRSG